MPHDSPGVGLSDDAPRRLVLRGEIDFRDAPAIRRIAVSLLEAGIAPLQVDARELEFLDSSGLSALIYAAGRAEDAGTCITLIGARAHMRRLLRITGLAFLFQFDPDVAPTVDRPPKVDPLLPAEIDLELPCDPKSLGVARARVGALLRDRGITREQRDDLFLALGEAIANAIRHGCPLALPDSRIRLHARVEPDEIIIEVTDGGPGFDPSSVPEPDVTRLKDGGMGLFFMRTVMDSVTYHHDDRGNTATMVKRLR